VERAASESKTIPLLSAGLVAAALACLMALRSGTEDLFWCVAVSGLGGLSTILTTSIGNTGTG
jgi:hypothetical protein